MEYLTLPGFGARFDDLDQFPPAAVAAALEDANGIADGFVSVLYPVLDIVPVMLRAAVGDIARRRLYRFDPPEGVQKAHDDAMRLLRDVGSGAMQLRVAAPVPDGEGETLIFSGSDVRRLDRRVFGYGGGDNGL